MTSQKTAAKETTLSWADRFILNPDLGGGGYSQKNPNPDYDQNLGLSLPYL